MSEICVKMDKWVTRISFFFFLVGGDLDLFRTLLYIRKCVNYVFRR